MHDALDATVHLPAAPAITCAGIVRTRAGTEADECEGGGSSRPGSRRGARSSSGARAVLTAVRATG